MVLGVGNSGGDAHGITATLRAPPTPGLPAREVTYRIASTTGLSSAWGIFGAGTARHIVIVLGPPVGTVTIGKLAVDGLNLRNPASRCLAASAPSPNLMSGLALGRLEPAGVTAERTSRPPVALGTFTLSRFAVSAGVPVSAAFSWRGLRLTRAEIPAEQARLAFARLGLETMTISFDAAYDGELDRDRISPQDLRLDIAELGSPSLQVLTSGPGALDLARLAHAVLRYKDASLFERALRAAAARALRHCQPMSAAPSRAWIASRQPQRPPRVTGERRAPGGSSDAIRSGNGERVKPLGKTRQRVFSRTGHACVPAPTRAIR